LIRGTKGGRGVVDKGDFSFLKKSLVTTTISGVNFGECYAERVVDELDGVEVNLISLKHLKINKRASGRHKDLNDLENLP
jgi:hypothetical protein